METIAENAGFKVLWLPPYHPMLNPIEEAWGITKGYVADTNDGRDFKKVRELVLEGMRRIKTITWESLVERAHENERKMIEKYRIEEDFPEPFIIDLDEDSEDRDSAIDDNEIQVLLLEDIVEDGEELMEFTCGV